MFADRSVSERSHGQMRGGTVRKDDDSGGDSAFFPVSDTRPSILCPQFRVHCNCKRYEVGY